MTIPPGMRAAGKTIMETVREYVPFAKKRLTPDEHDLAAFLRGNKELFEALCGVIQVPIEARTRLALSKEPNDSMISMARDKELRQLLAKLEFIYQSPVIEQAEEDEHPE